MSVLYIVSEYLSPDDITSMRQVLIRILQDNDVSPLMFGELTHVELRENPPRTCDLCGKLTSNVVVGYFDGKNQFPYPWAVAVCRDREPCRLRAAVE